jgi:hypothetical protein
VTVRGPAIAAAVLVVAAVTAWAWWPQVRNEFFVITGNRDEAGGYYGFWSGFAGGVRVFEWPVILGVLYWHHTCHDSPRCLRWGKYPAAGGLFKLCRCHHPDLQGQRPHRELIRRLHHEHRNAEAG